MKFVLPLLIISFICFDLIAQIPVAEDRLHQVIYEDEEVRVLEIIALPGDTAMMHQHDYNYCYIAKKGGKLWLQDYGEKSREVNLPTHYVGGKFELNKGPFIHRFSNIDTTEIQFFTIEHKSGLSTTALPELLPDDIVLQEDLFTVRKLELAPLSSKVINHRGTAFLLNLSDDPLLFSGVQAVPYWKRHDIKEKMHISNMGKVPILIAVFEVY